MVRPMLSTFAGVPLPQEAYFENLQSLYRKLAGIDKLLADPKTTTVRLVTNPEKVVFKETQRAFTYFCLYGLTVDAVIVNRIYPPEAQGGFFSTWKDTQERWVESVEEFFAPVPVWRVPMFDDEVLGVGRLRALGRALYGSRDPAKRYFDEAPYGFRKVNGKYELHLRLPFITSEEVDLYKKLDELVIRVGGFKRHVGLPQRMAHCEPVSARIKEGELIVVLGRNDAQPQTKSQASDPA
jgi:arsenite-transporting ATPase